jgi:hypothetical protein
MHCALQLQLKFTTFKSADSTSGTILRIIPQRNYSLKVVGIMIAPLSSEY